MIDIDDNAHVACPKCRAAGRPGFHTVAIGYITAAWEYGREADTGEAVVESYECRECGYEWSAP